MPQAIIFDFDGVIVDSEPLHYQAFAMVGKSFGFDFAWERYLAQFIGLDDGDAFKYMLVEAIEGGDRPEIEDVEATVAVLCDQKRTAFEALVAAQAAAVPGALELIDQAHAAGLPIAIATGSLRAEIEQMLGLMKRRDRFEVIVTADDVDRYKPDPMPYAKALDGLRALHPAAGLTADNTLAIEDTPGGLNSAIGAGLNTLALATTSPEEVLKDAGAGRVIEDLSGVTLGDLEAWYG